jgi:hypothetical protein
MGKRRGDEILSIPCQIESKKPRELFSRISGRATWKNHREFGKLCILEEIAHCDALIQCRKGLQSLCGAGTAHARYPSLLFERWFCRNQMGNEHGGILPVLPLVVDRTLVAELVESGKYSMEEGQRIASSFADLVTSICHQEVENLKREGDKAGLGSKVHVTHLAKFVRLNCRGRSVQLIPSVYQHLSQLYMKYARKSLYNLVNAYIFVLALRYETIGGPGFQVAVHESKVVGMQNTTSMVIFECFASPFNIAQLDSPYCSLWPQMEQLFGSRGNFFQMKFKEGIFEANPPFEPKFIASIFPVIEEALARAKLSLIFVVIIPHWKDNAGWQGFESSKFKHYRVEWKHEETIWENKTAGLIRHIPVTVSVFLLASAAASVDSLRNLFTTISQ